MGGRRNPLLGSRDPKVRVVTVGPIAEAVDHAFHEGARLLVAERGEGLLVPGDDLCNVGGGDLDAGVCDDHFDDGCGIRKPRKGSRS